MQESDLDWRPLMPGGASFQMYELEDEGERIRIKRSRQLVRFVGFFAAFIIGFPLLFGVLNFIIDNGTVKAGVILTSIGVALLVLFLRWAKNPGMRGEIDLTTRQWRIGSLYGSLNRVRAIQVLTERVARSEYSDSRSFELNLVLDNRLRVNLFDHAHQESALQLAERLGEALDVPVFTRIGP